MAIPNFDTIADAEIDPDSPLTSGLFNKYRNRDDHLEEWLGKSFVAAEDHDHDGVNSKAVAIGALFGSALFNLSTSGTTAVSTGALAFEPKIVIVVGVFEASLGDNDAFFTGFATGTGAAARSISAILNNVSTNSFSVDSDSIGGIPPSLALPGTSHVQDLDVTNFAKAAPGIEFTPSASIGTWTFKVLVFGFTA